MSNNKNSIIMSVGALVGISIVLGIFISGDKRLQKEIKTQADDLLDTSKRLLAKYKTIANLVAPPERTGLPEKNNEKEQGWENARLALK